MNVQSVDAVIISREDYNKLKTNEKINSNLLLLQKELREGSVVVWDGYYSRKYYFSDEPHYKQLIEDVLSLTNSNFSLKQELKKLEERLRKIPNFIKIAYKINE